MIIHTATTISLDRIIHTTTAKTIPTAIPTTRLEK